MKKIKFILCMLIPLLFVQMAVFAKSDEDSDADSQTEQNVVKKSKEELLEEQVEKKLKLAEEKKKKQEEKAAAKEKAKIAKQLAKDKLREKKDNYLGVVYVPEKTYELKRGKLRITLKGSTGSFNIYARGEDTPETAVLTKYDGSSSSYFSAKIGSTSYRLNQDAGVTRELRKLGTGAQLAYTVEKKVQIVVGFEPISSVLGAPEDLVRVTVYMTNISKTPSDIAIKALFDTILGEGTDYHFITSTGVKIKGEKQFATMKNERSVISSNGRTSVQFVLFGDTVSAPEWVSFSNRDSLVKGPWVPVIVDSRSFNTVLAYNNSALTVNWSSEKIKSGETSTISFYIAVATDSQMPNGLAFVDSLSTPTKEESVEIREEPKKQLDLKKPDVDFVLPPITDNQLDPVYIQNLIDRINALQSDPATVDRVEVRQLNAELDAILEKIRQQKQ